MQGTNFCARRGGPARLAEKRSGFGWGRAVGRQLPELRGRVIAALDVPGRCQTVVLESYDGQLRQAREDPNEAGLGDAARGKRGWACKQLKPAGEYWAQPSRKNGRQSS